MCRFLKGGFPRVLGPRASWALVWRVKPEFARFFLIFVTTE